MADILDREIMYLKGVGPKKAALLKKEVGIVSFRDMLYYFPFRHIDRSKFYKISEITEGASYVQVYGRILRMELVGTGRSQRLTATFSDGTSVMDLVWFKGCSYIVNTFKEGCDYVAFGKPNLFKGRYSIVHPEMESIKEVREKMDLSGLHGVYYTSEAMKGGGLTTKGINKIVVSIVQSLGDMSVPETLPPYIIEENRLMSLRNALVNIHLPKDINALRNAQFRLKFDELFYIQLGMLRKKKHRLNQFQGFRFPVVGDLFNRFYREFIPFELTEAQKRVLREIRVDMGSGKQMNRLLQGDVGSGKTMVALMSMLLALDNSFQACMMAPTEILATQHYESIVRMLQGMEVSVELLTGSTRKKERMDMLSRLERGEINILIGTHALLEDSVQFCNLGVVVIDEQHRFGVEQRSRLWAKNIQPPHVLVMTATPIPRTLAMTLYGDLDVSVIDELPPGRKPIKTIHRFDQKRGDVYDFIKQQIAQGRQAYIVYPMIKESEKSDYENLEAGFERLKNIFPEPYYRLGMVHGKMKPAEKDAQMQRFLSGETHILVATTVIEVGVNVPNASVMLIEEAERFGLSQLHQLRGRVGRGADQSYCILLSPVKLSKESRRRMEIMVETNNGFEIAEADLKLRGPGDLEGTQQSGVAISLKIANLATDGQLIQLAKNVAQSVLDEDPELSEEKNLILREQLSRIARESVNWGVIS